MQSVMGSSLKCTYSKKAPEIFSVIEKKDLCEIDGKVTDRGDDYDFKTSKIIKTTKFIIGTNEFLKVLAVNYSRNKILVVYHIIAFFSQKYYVRIHSVCNF